MLSLYIRCLLDESRCYCCTLDVYLMSRDAIVKISRQELPPKNSRQIFPPITFFTIKADQILTITTTNRSHTLLPSQPPTDQTIIMVLMVSYEAFACLRGSRDVVRRESYKPKTHGKLTMHVHDQSLGKTHSDVNYFWKEERVRLLVGSPGDSTTPIYSLGSSSTPIYSSGSSTPPYYSPRASTPQSYSPETSRNAECSNCKHLLGKITVLEATVKMYMHPEQHTVNSAALFHEVYNNMRKLSLE
uniref:Uncharacterized protein n=1 Tax=Tanacetum cinerariifolium TaxID=118510 RepID=A0A699IVM4_TANCI|nr:hypothetical protein [Tanacetum cinerariifolium]